ncbi:MAG: hypothetical protein Q9N02_00110 [Ghiorsea sp.]|nr:hypothetical protein [Ghiorsea sp.]
MKSDKKHYQLTFSAEDDLKKAKQWSLSRWGSALTQAYFSDLHQAAEYVVEHEIIIVAVMRQSRNIPEFLEKSAFMIQREVEEIKARLKTGKLKLP